MYKRFIRWASDRLADDGIIGFITNRAYLDARQDDGFRQMAAREFTDIYILDLGSDVRRNPKISGTTHNVFGIQTGVAIGFFVRDKARLGRCDIHYARREDAELASEKLAYLRNTPLEDIGFESIVPDAKSYWLNQSDSGFEQLLPLANRKTKLAKSASEEQAVFRLNSLGIVTARDEWVYDLDEDRLLEKIQFFSNIYQQEMQRYAREMPDEAMGAWVDKTIKWTSELTHHLTRGDQIAVSLPHIVNCHYRPFIVKSTYYAPIISHRRYQMPSIFPHGVNALNDLVCVCRNGKDFYVLATKCLPDYHLTGDSDCLPLYRYTADGERVSNITEWGLRHINDHYRKEWGAGFDDRYPDGIGAEDIFAYTYAVLHDPVYRHDYRVDLLREFPRLPLYHDFDHWAKMGQELLDLHLGFETADPYPLERQDQTGVEPRRAILRADKERGVITLDDQTTLTGVPADAWRYQLGSRSALEWVLDQYKERKPRDPTIRERFNTYRFADHKERVIDLLRRVCTVSVNTMNVVDSMAYWQDGRLIVFDDRDKNEWETAALSEWFGEPGGPDDDPEYQAWLASLPDIRDTR